MTTTATDTSPLRRHRRRSTLGWSLAVLSTAGTGFVVGYGSIWFQLFGDSADSGDYRMSAGGYATAAVLLVLAVPALVLRSRPALTAVTSTLAGLYLLLALDSAAEAGRRIDEGYSSAWDGIGGVVLSPTTWPLLVLSLLALRHIHRSGRGRSA